MRRWRCPCITLLLGALLRSEGGFPWDEEELCYRDREGGCDLWHQGALDFKAGPGSTSPAPLSEIPQLTPSEVVPA